jgi:DNA-binding response OmpR family regulator
MSKEKILIVEDDEVTAMNLKMTLQKLGYEVVSIAENTIQARNKIKIYEPDAILLDISLKEATDGIELAAYIKSKHQIPFIYLTSHSEAEILDEAKVTEPHGYIVKPFDPNGLHSTIQMALYKFAEERKLKEDMNSLLVNKEHLEKLLYNRKVSDKPLVPFAGDYHLDISTCETFYKDEKIKLTKKENAFIRILVAQLGLVVSFEQAMNYVWEEDGATENSVRTLVWRLRNKLPTDIIQNASGMGYYIEA